MKRHPPCGTSPVPVSEVRLDNRVRLIRRVNENRPIFTQPFRKIFNQMFSHSTVQTFRHSYI